MKVCCLLLVLLGSALGYKSYAGYQVIQTAPLNESSMKLLAPLLNNPDFDFWARPSVGRPADIMVAPEHAVVLRNTLKRLGLEPTTLIPDFGVVVAKERADIEAIKLKEKNRSSRAPSFERYLEFDEILAYIDEVVANYPELASVEDIGQSYEGRPLRVLKLSNGGGKPAIFMDSVLHAREWAGPPVAMYTIVQLTENYAENQAMLDAADFYFLLVANPDGFVFSWTDERMWRKTRSPNSGTNCVGTDPNRNFDWHWGEDGIPSRCDLTYPGTAAWSEIEVKTISEFLSRTPSITFYMAIHSYGQYLLFPWGHSTELPPTNDLLQQVGDDAADALRRIRGTRYQVGTAANVLYSAFGTSHDWAYGAQNIPLSYTLELPGGGSGGFNPPNSAIVPVVTETWEAVKVFIDNIPSARR